MWHVRESGCTWVIMATRQFFSSPIMYIYLRNQCLMSTFVVIQLFRSVSGCPYGKEGLVGDKICNSPWLMNQLATVERVRTTGRKQCWFCLFWRLTTFFWGCFSVFRTISDIVFKADILPTDDFFEWQVSCASPTHPFPRQLQRRSDIGYECSDQRCGT